MNTQPVYIEIHYEGGQLNETIALQGVLTNEEIVFKILEVLERRKEDDEKSNVNS